jgi:hypothetical protein
VFNPDETIHTSRQAFRLFEVVWQKGFEPCSNGSEALYARKIKMAEKRGNIKSAALWRKARDLDRLCYQNPAIIVIMDGERFHARYELNEDYSRYIRRAEPFDFTHAGNAE